MISFIIISIIIIIIIIIIIYRGCLEMRSILQLKVSAT